jgi:hypothetical protein
MLFVSCPTVTILVPAASRIMAADAKADPEKWTLVFGKDHAQTTI